MSEIDRMALASFAAQRWVNLSKSGVKGCQVDLDLVHGKTDTYRASVRLEGGPTIEEVAHDPFLAMSHAFQSAVLLVAENQTLC
jgi:hypothetical protein